MTIKSGVTVIFLILFTGSLAYSAHDTSPAAIEKQLRIVRITPAGEDVPPGRQIVIQFNRPVVPLGRMDRTRDEIPIEIEPGCNCEWRWLNTSALACQLGEKDALRAATRYKITIRPGIKTEDGTTISDTYKHEFITQRPKISYTNFNTWRSPEMPVIRVTLNQPVTKDSVKKHLYMIRSDGKGKRYTMKVEPDPEDHEKPRYILLNKEGLLLDFGEQKPEKSDDAHTHIRGKEARRIWLVSPVKELPPDTGIDLNIEPGLVSALGPAKGITNRIVVRFDTFPGFKFLGVACDADSVASKKQQGRRYRGREVLISPDMPEKTQPRCDPMGYVSLVFSSPVINEEVKEHVGFVPDPAGGREGYDPWANHWGYSHLRRPHNKGNTYRVTLPELLKAWQPYQVQSTANGPKDEFGRSLQAPIDFRFLTDHRKPDYTFTHNTAVLEKGVNSDVPLVVTNLREMTLQFKKLTPTSRTEGLIRRIPLPEAQDISYRIPLGIRDMLEGNSGAVCGTISTLPDVVKSHCERNFFSQVSPFQVHTKIGHFNTIVWVADFRTGEPVSHAKIRIYKDTIAKLSSPAAFLKEAETDDKGIAVLPGTVTLDPELQLLRWCNDSCYNCERLFIKVEKDGDMALLPLSYEFRLDTYRTSKYTVSPNTQQIYGHIRTWGTTAQGIYRAGDTIQYKLYVRNQDNNTFTPPPLTAYNLEIIDPTGKKVHEVNTITLSEFGAYNGEFTVPKTGAVGWYLFQLKSDFAHFTWQPMRVLVSDFTPAPFRVKSDINGEMFHQEDEVVISSYAKLHSGGPYTDAQARITANLASRYFSSGDPLVKGFRFDTYNRNARQTYLIYQTEAALDDKGGLVSKFVLPDKGVLYGRLRVESAVKDDRGKYIATSVSADYVGRDRFVGLKTTQWVYHEDEPARIGYVVVDDNGKPVKGTDIEITVERLVTKASRVKGAGNAYLTQYTDEWIAVTDQKLESQKAPGNYDFLPSDPGSFRITASIKDTKNRPHTTQIHAWVAGKGRVVWREPEDNSLQIIPEQDTYNVGDTARYLIKNPFPGATALVSIERYGVIRQWTETLKTNTPIIDFPVKPDDVPGFYLSVVVTSPRVDKPMGEGNVDLGKPAFRMGYVTVPVKDPYKEILVDVNPEQEVYKPRDRVKVTLHARPRHADKDEPIELAVAVLDEAVFDLLLQGRDSFDPYKGFYQLGRLDLENYSLLTRLVGRQKFEKKGADSGGGGGPDVSMRSLFKFVSYWNPALKTDAKGKAVIEFEVPDNLTGWRVFAMAVTPTDRMGLGDQGFKVNQPTEIRPVMPNQVTEGDFFKAGFSVMNRTDTSRTLAVSINASGPVDEVNTRPEHKKDIDLPPYKRTTVLMPVRTRGAGDIVFTVSAGDKVDGDGLRHVIPVKKRRSLETAATYGTTLNDQIVEKVRFPQNIHDDVGNVGVHVSPSVIGNVEGAFNYMRVYPYSCWEQKLTRGVMASHYLKLKDYLPETFSWAGAAKLPEATLEQAANFQAPNGGMVYYIPMNQYVSPYLSAYTALAFNWLRANGHQIPRKVEEKLHTYLSELLKKDVVPTFYSKGMSATVRAVALAALAGNGRVGLSDLKRYHAHVPVMSLFGKAHYLQAANNVKGAESIAGDVAQQILAHAVQSGGKFAFNEELDDSYKRILTTPLRANAAILTAFTALGEKDHGAQLVGDVPFKLVRSITQTRGNRDHWENTQENMFCMNALIEYSRVYENVAPDMVVRAFVDSKKIGKATFDDLRDDAVSFERPIKKGDPGRDTEIEIKRDGKGRLYYACTVSYAPREAFSTRTNAGIDIRREYSVERNNEWILLKRPADIRQGELVRVDIFLSLPTARNFVVVDDPVPGGLEPVNRDLATASTVDADKGQFKASGGSWWFQFSDWFSYNVSRWSFYHKELRHDAARFYSDYLPAGNYHLSYTAQAISAGEFVMMPVHAQEMYDPDVYGKGLSNILRVSGE